ncbi:MAG: PAS domain-containing protein [Phycisphaerales bacterium]|nr:PAS domain-containing protein [Phycisphaerales bacterium]
MNIRPEYLIPESKKFPPILWMILTPLFALTVLTPNIPFVTQLQISQSGSVLIMVGSILTIIIGTLILNQYATIQNRVLLITGSALLFIGLLDAIRSMYLIDMGQLFVSTPTHDAEHFITSTHTVSRMMLALAMVSVIFANNKIAESRHNVLEPTFLIISFTAAILATLGFAGSIPHPDPASPITHPIDLISASMMLLTALTYTIRTRITKSSYCSWIPITLVILAISQIQISFASTINDPYFIAGLETHLFAFLSVLALLSSTKISTIKSISTLREDLLETNAALATQVSAIGEHDIVAQTDASGKIVDANDAFIKISGYAREELIGQDHRILNSGTHSKEFFVNLWKAIAAGQIWKGDICNRAKDGSLYWVRSTIIPMIDSKGKINGHLAVRTDITELIKAHELLLEKNAELERFVYVASHDLKSPLVTIQGYTGLLNKEIEDGRVDRIENFASRISSATDKLIMVIDDLLAISRIGSRTINPELIDSKKAVEGIIRELELYRDLKDAQITIDADLPNVYCTPVHLHQVLQNLITNAIKYGHIEGQQLKISISGRSTNSQTQLIVSDNGPGIPEQFQPKIFELFSRLDSDQEGTGIGLAIVKRIADVHFGSITVQSPPEGGSSFAFSLPNPESVRFAHPSKKQPLPKSA